jgi:hypothetical protein
MSSIDIISMNEYVTGLFKMLGCLYDLVRGYFFGGRVGKCIFDCQEESVEELVESEHRSRALRDLVCIVLADCVTWRWVVNIIGHREEV